jgi:hypothetical protein
LIVVIFGKADELMRESPDGGLLRVGDSDGGNQEVREFIAPLHA